MDALPLLAAVAFTAVLIILSLWLKREQEKSREEELKRRAQLEALRLEAEREEQKRVRTLLTENGDRILQSISEYRQLHDSDQYFTVKSYRD